MFKRTAVVALWIGCFLGVAYWWIDGEKPGAQQVQIRTEDRGISPLSKTPEYEVRKKNHMANRKLQRQVKGQVDALIYGNLSQEPLAFLDKLRADFSRTLSAKEEAAARDIAARYLRWLEARRRLGRYEPTLDGVRNALEKKIKLRREILGDELAEEFFNDAESYDRYTLKRLQMEADADLSAEDKDTASRGLENQLTEAARMPLVRQRSMLNVNEVMGDYLGNDRPPHEFEQRLNQMVHQDARPRLLKLYQDRQSWRNRLALYRSERKNIEGQGLSQEVMRSRLGELLRRSFTALELKRLDALDQVQGLKPISWLMKH